MTEYIIAWLFLRMGWIWLKQEREKEIFLKSQFLDILFLALAAVAFEQALPEGIVVAAAPLRGGQRHRNVHPNIVAGVSLAKVDTGMAVTLSASG